MFEIQLAELRIIGVLFMRINNKIMDGKLFNVNIIYQGLFTGLVSTRAFSLFLIYRMFLNCVAFIKYLWPTVHACISQFLYVH